ncbi:DUF1830 domain-containing protein [Tychonema sp. LEGE 07203]|uniref:DUF1830 domain-containing protein n=1 Tax=Tychonema sp. LEGE 07203 TaxID=1828671 RepID=UPI0018800FE9|nr:DUF1830 domain-containing protein [Tychonema sp. LEGE 07203]MBE9097201.1 DUF1830 domain-containing protein [Tychonema sp. LEGE 07203]
MAQILDPLPSETDSKILCCYVNATSLIQIARISNIPNWYFERVVFPGQRLVFEAMSAAALEIHTGMMASAILSDTIPCDRLQINEGPYSNVNSSRSPGDTAGDRTATSGRPKSGKISEPLTVPALTAVD